LKRAYLRKVKPIVGSSGSVDSTDSTVGQLEQGSRGVRRRARTSAAMVGLAISMGAAGLVMPRQSDGAAAAESAGTGATVSPVPQIAPTADEPALSDAAPESTEIQHTVVPGETLTGVARKYQVTIAAIAKANKLSTRSTLQVGQVLKIPVQPEAQPISANPSTAAPTVAVEKIADDSLQTDREQALSRLRLQREQLQSKLLELRPDRTIEASQETSPKERHTSIAELPPSSNLPSSNLPSSNLPSSNLVVQSNSTQREPEQQVASTPAALQPEAATAAAQVVPQQEVPHRLAEPDWIRSNQALINPSSQASAEPSAPNSLLALRPATATPVAQPTVPQLPMVPQAPSEPVAYRVSPGDTVAEIAEAYNVPQSLLISANRISDPNFIFVGQVLQVPGLQTPVEQPSVEVKTASNAEVSLPTAVETAVAPAQVPQVPAVGGAAQLPEAVTVPTVPTVPTIVASEPSITSPIVPNPMLQQVAAAPISTTSETSSPASELTLPAIPGQSGAADSVTENSPFVQNLLAEIRTLRQQYQQRSGSAEVAQPVAPVAVPAEPATIAAATVSGSMAVNPQFQRRNEVRQQNEAAVEAGTPAPATNQPQTVAVAPLGSENYEPLLRPVTGRMVSPDLPPLPGADNFLPNQREVFDGFIWPARGVLTSGYGWRWGRMHRGIDIAADVGTPIYAAADGVIEFAGWNAGGYGNMIEIRHADGSMTRYAHLNRISVRSGQRVEQSQQIGEMGSTGYSTGPHLHFEVHLAQGTVNPISYLPRR